MSDPNDWSDFIADAIKPPTPPPVANVTPPSLNGLPTARDRAYALAGLRNECNALAAMAPDSGRNNKLNEAIFSLAGFVPTLLSEEEVTDSLSQAASYAGLTPTEIRATVRSALSGSKAKGVMRAVPPPRDAWMGALGPMPQNLADPGTLTANGSASAGADPDGSGALGLEAIEDSFWDSRESLKMVYEGALARLASPWAVLAFCAARALTLIPPGWTLPPIIGGKGSLNWFAALATKSGGGKGSASAVARELIPQPIYERNLGSGEGMVAAFERPKTTQDPQGGLREAVMFVSSEVDQMVALGSRTGSTLMSTLRQAFSGEGLGFSYVKKTIELPEHAYRLTYVCGVQPARAGGLLSDVAGGTPQRFMWFPALDRRISRDYLRTDPWMPTLSLPSGSDLFYDREITIPGEALDFIVDSRVDAARGDGDPLDSHAIFAREKFAFALAVLDGRTEMTLEDWELSGVAAAVSARTRQWVADHMTDAQRLEASDRGALKGVEHVAAERSKARETVAPARVLEVLKNRMQRDGNEGLTKKVLRDAAGRDKSYVTDALNLGLACGQVRQEGSRWFVC